MGLGAGFKLKDKEKELISPVDSEPALASIPYGWTAILEDWLSHAGGSNFEPPLVEGSDPHKVNGEPQSPATPNLKRRISTKAAVSRKGPYEILIKERMMGLYLSVYVHREIKHLVQGMGAISPLSQSWTLFQAFQNLLFPLASSAGESVIKGAWALALKSTEPPCYL